MNNVNNVTVDKGMQMILNFISLDYLIIIQFLDDMVALVLFSFFKPTCDFSIMAPLIYLPTNNVQDFFYIICYFSSFDTLNGVRSYPILASICISTMINNDSGHFFMYLLAIFQVFF